MEKHAHKLISKIYKESFLKRKLRDTSVKQKFSIIVILIIVIIALSTYTFYVGTRIMSGIRAYISGESLISKTHKEAVIDLLNYSDSYEEEHYEDFLHTIEMLRGYRQIRLAVTDKDVDRGEVSQGLFSIGVELEDLNDLIFIYQKFGWISYIQDAIRIWEDSDNLIYQLEIIGGEIHNIISPRNIDIHEERDEIEKELQTSLFNIYAVDQNFTLLERDFASVLDEGSREIKKVLIIIAIIFNSILGLITVIIAMYIGRVTSEVERAKTEFLSLSSHQLRTPPTSMKWFLEMLLSGDAGSLNDKQKEYVEEIYKNNERMITMSNLLLSSSRMEMGVSNISKIKTDIIDLLKSTLKEHEFHIKEKNLVIDTKYPQGESFAITDPKLLKIVFQNIFFNAIKYTPPQGYISLEMEKKISGDIMGGMKIPKEGFVVSVSDTGYGIPESEYRSIFTKLYRASNIKEKDTDGTGLGLYLSKSILDKLGGSIWFQSEINKGTTFYIFIPL